LVSTASAQGSDPTAPALPPSDPAAPPPPGTTRLDTVVVHGRSDSLVGIAESASQGTVGAEQLEERPIFRPGEILETVPGLIVTQHSGEGKANQFFLRGFNLDHGTDFATSIDGVPVNLPSHGHGQGYSDLNFLIPELVQRIDFRKGPYFADQGDFSSAGAADIRYFRELPQNIAQFSGGMFDYYRTLVAASTPVLEGHALYALDLMHDNGPWEHANHFRKLNSVLRYSIGDESFGGSITTSAYAGKWDSTDQIAERAISQTSFGRFDSLDTSDGGQSQKYMLYGELHRSSESSATRALLYGFYQDLDLFSNFTYFLDSPAGDQFKQIDRRWVGGGSVRNTLFCELFGMDMESSAGLQLRSDSIRNGLVQTVSRTRTDKPDHDGGIIPAITRRDDIWELSLAPYVENRIQWHEKVRSTIGARLDWFHFDVNAFDPIDSGKQDDVKASPKGSLVFGPWADTELYLSAGMGYHSNDARGVTAPVDPADPLVRTYGAEIGVRSTYLRGLHSTIAFWWLDLDSELIFVGDAGNTEASRPSRRYGVEIANYYSPTEWLTLDADASISHARFRDSEPEGDHIPGSIESVVAAGVSLHDLHGFFGELRLRYFGPRALVEDDSVRADDVVLLTARVGYEITKNLQVSVEIFNLLDRADSDIQYYYPSRLAGEPAGPDEGGVNDIHLHPVSPVSVRAALTARF
jgi:outer membrane receptor protein involved in Fe transport